jgi:deoxycytidylate deaminase
MKLPRTRGFFFCYSFGMTDEEYMREAAREAAKALCLRAKCGSIVVLNDEIIGRGYNAPPNDNISARKCTLDLVDSPKPKSDRTCCVHAEWRAITYALKNKKDIRGSALYFTRVDDAGEILKSGEPYCTVCSRLALDNGVAYFALWHEGGIKKYDTGDYNERSYHFHTLL